MAVLEVLPEMVAQCQKVSALCGATLSPRRDWMEKVPEIADLADRRDVVGPDGGAERLTLELHEEDARFAVMEVRGERIVIPIDALDYALRWIRVKAAMTPTEADAILRRVHEAHDHPLPKE